MKFKNLIRDIILEDARLEHLLTTHAHKDIVKVNKETGQKKVKRAPLTAQEMMIIVGNDPTSRIEGIDVMGANDEETLKKISPDNVKKTGEYTQWIIKQFKSIPQTLETPYTEREAFAAEYKEKKRLFFEDLYKVKEDLIKFHRYKSSPDKIKEADINKYNIRQLEDAVSGLSLEMATTTASERKSSLLHPGAEFMVETPKWYVVTMTRNDELGKEAAVYYGGNQQRTSRGETSWCTSAPGYNYYFNYLKQGPYYVIIDKTDEKKGEVSGLPAHRYQFHFESNQFMDADDRQIDFVKFFNDNPELKEAFKTIITKHFSQKGSNNSNKVEISYPSDGISKIIGLYGFEDFFNNLPETLEIFEFAYSGNRGYRQENFEPPKLDIPASISRFKNLKQIYLDQCVNSLPDSIGELKNLEIIGLPNNDGMVLPDSMAKLIEGNLQVLMVSNSTTREKLSKTLQDALDKREQLAMENPAESSFVFIDNSSK